MSRYSGQEKARKNFRKDVGKKRGSYNTVSRLVGASVGGKLTSLPGAYYGFKKAGFKGALVGGALSGVPGALAGYHYGPKVLGSMEKKARSKKLQERRDNMNYEFEHPLKKHLNKMKKKVKKYDAEAMVEAKKYKGFLGKKDKKLSEQELFDVIDFMENLGNEVRFGFQRSKKDERLHKLRAKARKDLNAAGGFDVKGHMDSFVDKFHKKMKKMKKKSNKTTKEAMVEAKKYKGFLGKKEK